MRTFEDWVEEFVETMIRSGAGPGSLHYKVGGKYESDARRYWERGVSPGDAVVKELLG